MHLLAAQAGALQQEGEAIDLAQSPAPLVFASAADSELMLLAGAADRAGRRDLRLANLLRLAHNLSVDLWLDKTVQHARVVVLRLLGGAAYWSYGVEQLTVLAAQRGIRLALLPGDATPDPLLQQRSTVSPEVWSRLHALFTAGGPDNADALLTLIASLATEAPELAEVTPFQRFGYWTPTGGMAIELPSGDRPAVPLLFYRAALEGAGTATIEALYREIERQGLMPVPLVVSTLKEGACVRFVKAAFAQHRPQAILNLTGFALGIDGLDDKLNPFAETDAAVIQLVQGGRPEALWAADSQGLSAKDLAMQIVLPELDGRIGGLIVGHKADAVWHAATECPLSTYAPDLDGIRRAVTLAASYARLRATPPSERHVAIVLANYPIRDGRLANGVGYDAPESTARMLQLLAEAGYDTTASPSPGPSPQGGGEREALHWAESGPKDIGRARELQGPGEAVFTNASPTPSPSPQGGGEREAVRWAESRPKDIGRARELQGRDEAGFTTASPTPGPSPQGGGGREAARWAESRPKNVGRARELRHAATPPEHIVWRLLRSFEHAHFRRQVPIGPYFADFACHHPKLVIELDGHSHGTEAAQRHDERRDAFLKSAGYHVLRFWNGDVTTNPDAVGETILATLTALSPPSPLRGGAGGGGLSAFNSGAEQPPTASGTLTALSPPSPLRGGAGGGGGGPSAENSGTAEPPPASGTLTALSPPSPLRGGVGGGGPSAGNHAVEQPHPAYRSLTGNTLIELLQSGPTNADPGRPGGIPFPVARYRELLAALPPEVQAAITARWGAPEADPFVREAAFHLPALAFGNVVVLLQPARGYDRDATAAYHDPDLVPPHAYVAAYLWLRHEFGAHALIHNGKHGSLEWLPGKAVALDAASYPALLWGELPHLYPFIVNDPGEGTQAKRRTGAAIIDHLVPPLTRAETYGPLKDLEALLDEYYAASGMDRRRLRDLRKRILDFTRDTSLDRDIGLPADETEALLKIDTFLCDLKEAQIRDGLHIFGKAPAGRLERDLLAALARVPRGDSRPGEASLVRALADDLKLGFDPLTAELGRPWQGPGDWRRVGDVVEHLEDLATQLIDGAPPPGPASAAVRDEIEAVMRPRLAASGPAETAALLAGLDGRFIAPGPSGAPTRGRLDVLPTGRNFYSVDNRAIPTPSAWELGRKSAEALLLRHFQEHGTSLRSLALSVWGTSNMRTGGDDIAQALAFIGARPTWDPASLRLSGYEIIPLAKLGRPRVDVTLRISGLFRDAFPQQIALFDRAVRAIGALDEPEDQNPVSARMRTDALGLIRDGASEAEAALKAGHRIFGSKPGAYGAGLQALIDSGSWSTKADLGRAFLNWGQYAYGAHAAGVPERDRFAARLGDIEAVVHNQDNREHDLLDSDDYYQFEGGLVATAESLTGRRPAAYHADHSRPERPLARTLEEEISRVMRSRVVNPKWIEGVMRHGYKGAFEIIATVDYMFAFAATTGAVKTHHFDLAFSAFVEDERVRDFIRTNNRFGYDELLRKFEEARRRGFWSPRSNAVTRFFEESAQ